MELTNINKYHNMVFYKIVCNDSKITDCFIGYTINLANRILNHHSIYNCATHSAYCLTVYQFIRNHGGWDNFKFVVIETPIINDSTEFHHYMKKYMKEFNSSLNLIIPSRPANEVHIENLGNKTPYQCACGGHYLNKNRNQHVLSARHRKFITA